MPTIICTPSWKLPASFVSEHTSVAKFSKNYPYRFTIKGQDELVVATVVGVTEKDDAYTIKLGIEFTATHFMPSERTIDLNDVEKVESVTIRRCDLPRHQFAKTDYIFCIPSRKTDREIQIHIAEDAMVYVRLDGKPKVYGYCGLINDITDDGLVLDTLIYRHGAYTLGTKTIDLSEIVSIWETGFEAFNAAEAAEAKENAIAEAVESAT